MKKGLWKRTTSAVLVAAMAASMMTGCGNKSNVSLNDGTFKEVDEATLKFPLAEKTTLTGTISYPANTESDPNKRTIFERLQEKTNVDSG